MINSNQVIKKSFNELSKSELYAILALRMQVFCVEQNCPYQDADNNDQDAQHVYIESENAIIAYARIIQEKQNEYHIGRVVVAENNRKDGLASIIMKQCITIIKIFKVGLC